MSFDPKVNMSFVKEPFSPDIEKKVSNAKKLVSLFLNKIKVEEPYEGFYQVPLSLFITQAFIRHKQQITPVFFKALGLSLNIETFEEKKFNQVFNELADSEANKKDLFLYLSQLLKPATAPCHQMPIGEIFNLLENEANVSQTLAVHLKTMHTLLPLCCDRMNDLADEFLVEANLFLNRLKLTTEASQFSKNKQKSLKYSHQKPSEALILGDEKFNRKEMLSEVYGQKTLCELIKRQLKKCTDELPYQLALMKKNYNSLEEDPNRISQVEFQRWYRSFQIWLNQALSPLPVHFQKLHDQFKKTLDYITPIEKIKEERKIIFESHLKWIKSVLINDYNLIQNDSTIVNDILTTMKDSLVNFYENEPADIGLELQSIEFEKQAIGNSILPDISAKVIAMFNGQELENVTFGTTGYFDKGNLDYILFKFDILEQKLNGLKMILEQNKMQVPEGMATESYRAILKKALQTLNEAIKSQSEHKFKEKHFASVWKFIQPYIPKHLQHEVKKPTNAAEENILRFLFVEEMKFFLEEEAAKIKDYNKNFLDLLKQLPQREINESEKERDLLLQAFPIMQEMTLITANNKDKPVSYEDIWESVEKQFENIKQKSIDAPITAHEEEDMRNEIIDHYNIINYDNTKKRGNLYDLKKQELADWEAECRERIEKQQELNLAYNIMHTTVNMYSAFSLPPAMEEAPFDIDVLIRMLEGESIKEFQDINELEKQEQVEEKEYAEDQAEEKEYIAENIDNNIFEHSHLIDMLAELAIQEPQRVNDIRYHLSLASAQMQLICHAILHNGDVSPLICGVPSLLKHLHLIFEQYFKCTSPNNLTTHSLNDLAPSSSELSKSLDQALIWARYPLTVCSAYAAHNKKLPLGLSLILTAGELSQQLLQGAEVSGEVVIGLFQGLKELFHQATEELSFIPSLDKEMQMAIEVLSSQKMVKYDFSEDVKIISKELIHNNLFQHTMLRLQDAEYTFRMIALAAKNQNTYTDLKFGAVHFSHSLEAQWAFENLLSASSIETGLGQHNSHSLSNLCDAIELTRKESQTIKKYALGYGSNYPHQKPNLPQKMQELLNICRVLLTWNEKKSLEGSLKYLTPLDTLENEYKEIANTAKVVQEHVLRILIQK